MKMIRDPRQLDLFARRPTPTPGMDVLERALAAARQELHNLQVMAMKPGRTAEQLEHLRDLERSCRAEIRLRKKALEHRRTLDAMPSPRATPTKIDELRQRLAADRREVRNLQVLQMRPGHSPEKLELLHKLERSARASVKLAQKALRYAEGR